MFMVLSGYFYALNESKKDLLVYYKYDGLHPEVIQRGLSQWRELRHSEDPRSVMSNNIHVNADDLKNANKIKSLFYYKKIIFNMIDKILTAFLTPAFAP